MLGLLTCPFFWGLSESKLRLFTSYPALPWEMKAIKVVAIEKDPAPNTLPLKVQTQSTVEISPAPRGEPG
jgi:hypothetical protein